MKTEMEKCLAGEVYNCHDKIFIELKRKSEELTTKYNSISYDKRGQRYNILKELFGSIGTNVSVGKSFTCGYGCNIHIGNNVSINLNCTLIDCNRITIGNNVLIAPHVHINTATHPIDLDERLTPNWSAESGEYFCRTYTLPVVIEDGCWIGGSVTILPGVTIGRGSVIGAGSVVVKDIPANSLAVGNPCKVLRKINEK